MVPRRFYILLLLSVFCSTFVFSFGESDSKETYTELIEQNATTLNEDNSATASKHRTAWDKAMEKSGRWVRNGVTGYLLRNVLQKASQSNVSTACKRSIEDYSKALDGWKRWAVHMADSTSKIPAGLLDGTQIDFGSFEECLAVRTETFKGQYCLIGHYSPLMSNTKHNKLGRYIQKYGEPPDWIRRYLAEHGDLSVNGTLWLATCMPSTCAEEEIKIIYENVASEHDVYVKIMECQTDDPKEIPRESVFALSIVVGIVLYCIVGTVYDVWIVPPTEERDAWINENFLLSSLRVFSMSRRIKKLQKDLNTDHPLNFLNGAKALVCLLTILGHTYMYPDKWRYVRMSHVMRLDADFGKMRALADNAALVMAVYFVLSGFVVPLTLWTKLQKKGAKINIFRFIMHRFMRVIPTFLLSVSFVFIVPILSRGPIWNTSWAYFSDNCKANIWANFLFISNYWHLWDQCLPHAWILPVLVQCEIIIVILLIILKWKPKLGIFLGLFILTSTSSWVFYLSIKYNHPVPSPYTINDVSTAMDYATIFYAKFESHIGSALVGVGCFFLIGKYRNIRLSKMQHIIGWSFAFVTLFGTHVMMELIQDHAIYGALYTALYHPVYAMGLGWLLFASVTGNGGFFNSIMTCRPVILLGSISFVVMNVHPFVQTIKTASLKERLHFGGAEHQYEFVAVFGLSFVLSFFGYIMVEAPFNELRSKLLGSVVTVEEVPTAIKEETDTEKKTE